MTRPELRILNEWVARFPKWERVITGVHEAVRLKRSFYSDPVKKLDHGIIRELYAIALKHEHDFAHRMMVAIYPGKGRFPLFRDGVSGLEELRLRRRISMDRLPKVLIDDPEIALVSRAFELPVVVATDRVQVPREERGFWALSKTALYFENEVDAVAGKLTFADFLETT